MVFTYALPVSASVSVMYQDNAGNLLNSQVVTVGVGSHTIYANLAWFLRATHDKRRQRKRICGCKRQCKPYRTSVCVCPPSAITEAPPNPRRLQIPLSPMVPTMPPETVVPIITNPPAPSGRDYNILRIRQGLYHLNTPCTQVPVQNTTVLQTGRLM